jgi:hypothetical protein
MSNEYDPNNYGPRAEPRHRDKRRSVPLTGAAEALYQHARIAEYPGEHPIVAQSEHASMILDVIHEATEKERRRCLDIVKGLRSDSPTWSRDDDALIDGCSGPDLIDAIVDELARRIGTAS